MKKLTSEKLKAISINSEALKMTRCLKTDTQSGLTGNRQEYPTPRGISRDVGCNLEADTQSPETGTMKAEHEGNAVRGILIALPIGIALWFVIGLAILVVRG